MNKLYIVKDWAGNTMEWGTFNSFDEAWTKINEHVHMELLAEGVDTNKTYGLQSDYPAFEDVLETIISEYSSEYCVEEYVQPDIFNF